MMWHDSADLSADFSISQALRSNLYLYNLKKWVLRAQQWAQEEDKRGDEDEEEDGGSEEVSSKTLGSSEQRPETFARNEVQRLSASARLNAALEQHRARIRGTSGISESLPNLRVPRLPQVARKVAAVANLHRFMRGQGGASGAQTQRSSRASFAATARTPGSTNTTSGERSVGAAGDETLAGRGRWMRGVVRSRAVMVLRPPKKAFAEWGGCESLRAGLAETIASSASLINQFDGMTRSLDATTPGRDLGVIASPGMRMLNSRGKSRSLRLAIPNVDGTTTLTPRRQGPRSLLRSRREVMKTTPSRFLGDEFDDLFEESDEHPGPTSPEERPAVTPAGGTPLLRSVQRRRMKRMARARAAGAADGDGAQHDGDGEVPGTSPSPSPLQRYLPGVGRAYVKAQRVRATIFRRNCVSPVSFDV